MTTSTTLRIDTWNDIVCPWCYVGEARLTSAVEALGPNVDVTVVPHAFELNPDHDHPERVLDMIARKFGRSEDEAREMDSQISALALAEGLPYTSERMTANTFDAHRLVAAARAVGGGATMLHALQRGHFSGELDLSNADALVAAADQAGLGADRARAVLGSDEFADEVHADQDTARRIGVTGVPFTVLGEELAIPGCAGSEQYGEALRQALDRGVAPSQ